MKKCMAVVCTIMICLLALGGCMKKPLPTFIDETALITDAFYCSAGRRGAQIRVDPQALADYVGAQFADLTEE